MPEKKSPPEPGKRKTSLSIDRSIYRRAKDYKNDIEESGKAKDLGEIVSEALDEYLKKRGA